MRSFLLILAYFSTFLGVSEPLADDEVINSYAQARLRMETIRNYQMHFSFGQTSQRTGIPENRIFIVNAHEHTMVDGYFKGQASRVDYVDDSRPEESSTVATVRSDTGSFTVVKAAGERKFRLSGLGGQDELTNRKRLAAASGFLEAAYVLPQLDVKDVMLGDDYDVSAAMYKPNDRSGTIPDLHVVCKFRRTKIPAPNSPAGKMYVESGTFVLLPDRDWAIHDYSFGTNTGLRVAGDVEYQEVAGLPLKSVPRRSHFLMTRTNSTQRTDVVLEGTFSDLGRVDDRRFTLEDFGLGSLSRKQFDGIDITYVLIGLGALSLLLAIGLRILGHRAENHRIAS